MKSKKSIWNILSGITGQAISILFGIYIPRLVILSLGPESNGLLNSVNTVISYLNLLEAGIGVASLQALYGSVAENNEQRTNGILSATKLFYQKTAVYYCLGIVGIAFIYPAVIASTIPFWEVFAVILLSGIPQIVNFYFQGKYKVLLQADGKIYIITNMQTITTMVTSLMKVVLLNYGFGLIALQGMYCCVSLAQMVYIEYYVHKSYPFLDLTVKPETKALSQKDSVLVHQISGLVFNSTDTIILSVVCGLQVVSIYSIYTLLFGMITTLIQNINSGVVFIMGQTFNADKKKYVLLHYTYEVYNMALTFSLFFVAYQCIIPFVHLYTAGAEIEYVDPILPIMFVLINLLENGRTACIKAIHFAGHFKQTRWHAIAEMILNITVSIFGSYYLGIYGVLLGTVAALLFRSNAIIIYCSKHILNRSSKSTYLHWGINVAIFTILSVVSRYISIPVLNSYFKIGIYAVLVAIVTLPVFFIVNSLLNRKEYMIVKRYALGVLQQHLR